MPFSQQHSLYQSVASLEAYEIILIYVVYWITFLSCDAAVNLWFPVVLEIKNNNKNYFHL